MPLIGVLLNIVLLSVDVLFGLKVFFFCNLAYLIFCWLESLRVTKSFKKSFSVFPFIYLSLWSLGFGSLYALFRGDIYNDYSMYKNAE